jgi:hypothetical protein
LGVSFLLFVVELDLRDFSPGIRTEKSRIAMRSIC